MNTCHIKELMENNYEFSEDSGAAAVENSMPPEIPMRSQLDTISEDIISRVSRETEISRIVYLNLFNNKIKKIQCMQSMPNLLTLILSFNEIEEIEGLSTNAKLRKIEISHNFIRSLKNMQSLTELTFLDIRHNWIEDLNCLDHVVQHCTSLEELGFKSNPASTKSRYRATIFKKMPAL
jgi:Leucine-rich repeat (LRR) protein